MNDYQALSEEQLAHETLLREVFEARNQVLTPVSWTYFHQIYKSFDDEHLILILREFKEVRDGDVDRSGDNGASEGQEPTPV